MDAQRPSMTATGAGAGTIVVICPGCGRQTARHPRPWAAASSRGPHLAAGSRARLNGRPRSRHLPGRSPVGRRPPRSPRRPVATPVLPAPRETPPPRALGAPVSQSLSAPVSANGWPYTVGGARDPAPASSSQAGRSPGRRQGRRPAPGPRPDGPARRRGPYGRTGLFREDDDPPMRPVGPTRWPMRPWGRAATCRMTISTATYGTPKPAGRTARPKTTAAHRGSTVASGTAAVTAALTARRAPYRDTGSYAGRDPYDDGQRGDGPYGPCLQPPPGLGRLSDCEPDISASTPDRSVRDSLAVRRPGVCRFLPLGRLSVSRAAVSRNGYFRCEPFRGAPARTEVGQMPGNVHVT